jgi:hypothetical protein
MMAESAGAGVEDRGEDGKNVEQQQRRNEPYKLFLIDGFSGLKLDRVLGVVCASAFRAVFMANAAHCVSLRFIYRVNDS